MSAQLVTVTIVPTDGAPITQSVEVPPEGMTINDIMKKLGRSANRLNFSVTAGPDTRVSPGTTVVATEPQPAKKDQLVLPGAAVRAAERPAGS